MKLYLFILCVIAAVWAVSIPHGRTRLEEPLHAKHHVPAGWRSIDKINTKVDLHLIIALKQRNVDRLMKIFEAVSDPNSEEYGNYLTLDEIHSLVAPAPYTVDAVVSWLKRNNAKSIDHKNDFIEFVIDVADANKMLACEFHLFEHKASGKRLVRSATPYSVPSDLAQHIDFVDGVMHFPKVPKRMVNSAQKATKDTSREALDAWQINPTFLRQYYSVGNVQGQSSNNSQCVVEFQSNYFSQTDLDEFWSLFYSAGQGSPTIIGDNNFPYNGDISSVDIQYIMSIGANISTVFWSNGGDEVTLLKWLVQVDNMPDAPLLFSVSYADDESYLTLIYMNRMNTEFVKHGTRGITFIFASGDWGVGGDNTPNCIMFEPSFPATSPYITAVGGTEVDGWWETGPEVVYPLTSGGFSQYFFRPKYQNKAVSTYLSTAQQLPPTSYWNTTGRGFPDVSVLATPYVAVIGLLVAPANSGTECATPVFSGMVALLNDIRLQNGKSPLGFLNPLLYDMAEKYPHTFSDITQGSNPNCNTNGFPATVGWDAVSGLGTPNFTEIANVILNY